MTEQEQLLAASVQSVQGRLCTHFGVIYQESGSMPPVDDIAETMRAWSERIEHLVEWLDWPTAVRCEEVCAWDVRRSRTPLQFLTRLIRCIEISELLHVTDVAVFAAGQTALG